MVKLSALADLRLITASYLVADWQVGRLLAFEDTAAVTPDSVQVEEIRPIEQAPGRGEYLE